MLPDKDIPKTGVIYKEKEVLMGPTVLINIMPGSLTIMAKVKGSYVWQTIENGATEKRFLL